MFKEDHPFQMHSQNCLHFGEKKGISICVKLSSCLKYSKYVSWYLHAYFDSL